MIGKKKKKKKKKTNKKLLFWKGNKGCSYYHITIQAFLTYKTPVKCRSNSASPMATLVAELHITEPLNRAGSSCSNVAGLQKATAKLARSHNLVILYQYEPQLCLLLPHTASSLMPAQPGNGEMLIFWYLGGCYAALLGSQPLPERQHH